MKLKAYHNPQGADESLVPDGWRMLYADEFPLRQYVPCRLFISPVCAPGPERFSDRTNCTGTVKDLTYIIPVAP